MVDVSLSMFWWLVGFVGRFESVIISLAEIDTKNINTTILTFRSLFACFINDLRYTFKQSHNSFALRTNTYSKTNAIKPQQIKPQKNM